MILNFAVMTVVEDVVATIFCEYLATMAWAIEEIALLARYDGRSITFAHRVAIAVAEYAGQSSTATYHKLVGVVLVPASTYEHIPISVAIVKITPLENSRTRTILLVGQSCYVGVFCPFLNTESIGREFYAVHLADTAEEEPHSAFFVVYNHLGVNGVANARFGASGDYSAKFKMVGRNLFQYTNTTIARAIVECDVEQSLSVYGRHIGCPKVLGNLAHLAPRLAVDNGTIDNPPMEEVFAYKCLSCASADAVVVAVFALPDRWVRPTWRPYRIFNLLRLDECYSGDYCEQI